MKQKDYVAIKPNYSKFSSLYWPRPANANIFEDDDQDLNRQTNIMAVVGNVVTVAVNAVTENSCEVAGAAAAQKLFLFSCLFMRCFIKYPFVRLKSCAALCFKHENTYLKLNTVCLQYESSNFKVLKSVQFAVKRPLCRNFHCSLACVGLTVVGSEVNYHVSFRTVAFHLSQCVSH